MKAAQINDYGDTSVLQINEIDKPVASGGKVLVEVRASSINPFDAKLMMGVMKDSIPLQFPATLGGDFSGIIVEVGEGVTNFSVGDKVYGQAAVVAGNSGAFAQYATTKAKEVAKMPANLDFVQAASLPLVGVSAWQALVKHLQLGSGQKLFIHGGAGGIGSIAIQIAKHIGAYIAVTATGDDIKYVKQLGADDVVDYKSQDFTEELKDFDAVFDTVGGDDFNKTLDILKRSGKAVSMAASADEAKAKELDVEAITQGTKVNTEALNALSELVENDVVKPQIDKIFPLEQIQEAFKAKQTSRTRGKIVIKIMQ